MHTTTTNMHLTLNCRHIARTSAITSPEELAAVQPLLERGGPIPTRDPYWVDLERKAGWASFCLNHGAVRLTMNVIVWDETIASELWAGLEFIWYRKAFGQFGADLDESAWPVPPALTPWLATLTYPILAHPDWSVSELRWIGAFERIYAEALLAKITA